MRQRDVLQRHTSCWKKILLPWQFWGVFCCLFSRSCGSRRPSCPRPHPLLECRMWWGPPVHACLVFGRHGLHRNWATGQKINRIIFWKAVLVFQKYWESSPSLSEKLLKKTKERRWALKESRSDHCITRDKLTPSVRTFRIISRLKQTISSHGKSTSPGTHESDHETANDEVFPFCTRRTSDRHTALAWLIRTLKEI